MATITINEISKNYSYSTGTSTFSSVALPITASWGPAFEDPASLGKSVSDVLEETAFEHFAATQEGLEAFTATYRGPAANYRGAKDYSYQIAVTLLTSGYDLDVCRVCSGSHASAAFTATIGTGDSATTGTITLKAKYPGSFGNNLVGVLKKVTGRTYWNLITYIVDSTGGKTAVENLVFVLDLDNSTDTIPHISEITSSFFDIIIDGVEEDEDVVLSADTVTLTGGSDRLADGTSATGMIDDAIALATTRFNLATATDKTDYVAALTALKTSALSISRAATIRYMEWNYNAAYYVLDILTDKLAYNSRRLIMPGWDDQNFWFLSGGETVSRMNSLSPLHCKMMEVAAQSRCMTALIDIPKSLERSGVWVDSTDTTVEGYAQKISRYLPSSGISSDGLFSTHYALFGPWCQYKYVGVARNTIAPPGFLKLMLDIAMIKNQSLQYEWAAPENRKTNLIISSPDFKVPNSLLEQWQSIEGVSINILTTIPDIGFTVWGDSTSYEVPPATFNALQNLTTRYLFNALRDLAYRCGISITFQYNNQEAYSKFVAGMSPLLDTMVSVGAIEKYQIDMAKDLNALDSVNLNSVQGILQVWCRGIINSITLDLVALPAED